MGRGSVGVGVAVARMAALCVLGLTLAHCGKAPNKYGVAASPRVVEPGEPVPKGGGSYRVGTTYTVAGRSYTPEENTSYSAEGLASWYGEDFHGRLTANREVYDMHAISAAHPTLPIPSYVRVTNLANRRSIIARVNDRGPYHPGRVIDVSVRTAKLLGFYESGTTRVRVDFVGRASLQGSDDSKLEATLRHGDPPRHVNIARYDDTPRSSRDAPRYSDTSRQSDAPARRSAPAAVAANRPVEPEYFDPRPLTQRGTLIPNSAEPRREPAPAQGRRVPNEANAVARAPLAPAAAPTLASSRSVPAGGPGQARAAAADAPVSFDSRFAPAHAMGRGPGPTAPAYAPSAPARSDGVMTGRGLY